MGKATSLIVEDEPDIIELVEYNLKREGFDVIGVSSGEDALRMAKSRMPDLVLLDLMLPSIDGLEVCRKLKESSDVKHIPIIMLTAKSEDSDIVLGLGLGADDYVTKPFSPKQLIARVLAVLRRSQQEPDANTVARVCLGGITIDSNRHEVFLGENPVNLTLAEFRLLRSLVTNPGRVLTREQLLDKITDGDCVIIDRNVDVHIRAIRKKLGDEAERIVTVRGIGYKCQG